MLRIILAGIVMLNIFITGRYVFIRKLRFTLLENFFKIIVAYIPYL